MFILFSIIAIVLFVIIGFLAADAGKNLFWEFCDFLFSTLPEKFSKLFGKSDLSEHTR